MKSSQLLGLQGKFFDRPKSYSSVKEQKSQCAGCQEPIKFSMIGNKNQPICRLCGFAFCDLCSGEFLVEQEFLLQKDATDKPNCVCWGCRNTCLAMQWKADNSKDADKIIGISPKIGAILLLKRKMQWKSEKERIVIRVEEKEKEKEELRGVLGNCSVCDQPKSRLNCRVCTEIVCKKCSIEVDFGGSG
jgi:hypothetical protein